MATQVKSQLAVLRALHGRIAQAELARRTGISQKQLSALERGKTRGIDFRTMERLCVFFRCTPGELLVLEVARPAAQTRAQTLVESSLARVMAEPPAAPAAIWDQFDQAVARMRQPSQRVIKAVIDTSVFVAALLSRSNASVTAKLLNHR